MSFQVFHERKNVREAGVTSRTINIPNDYIDVANNVCWLHESEISIAKHVLHCMLSNARVNNKLLQLG